MPIRCIIVDDEPMARKGLEDHIKDIEFLELMGSFRNAMEAHQFLSENAVDLVFLDIKMPKISGIDFWRSLKNPPLVVFTTAYREHAVEGFELEAVDYLVKPIAFDRFLKAANKAGKGGESHNGHGGWHLVACFELHEASGNIQFTHLEIADLVSHQEEEDGDWHYCGSTVDGATGSQRTETYYTTGRGTSKLRDGSVYLDTDRVTNWTAWQHCRTYAIPPYSPLYFQRLQKDMNVPSLHHPEKFVRWSRVKSQLNKLDPLWPLSTRTQLADLSVPQELIDIIRPEES